MRRRDSDIRHSQEARAGASLDADFTGAVLAATSGSPCGRAREYLCRGSSAELAGWQQVVLDSHVKHCQACSRFEVVCQTLDTELPMLAEVDPGFGFAAAVLAGCRDAGQAPWNAGWRRLRQWLQRPLFPLEAAYVGALVVFMGFTAALGSAPSARSLARIERAAAPASAWVSQLDQDWDRIRGASVQQGRTLQLRAGRITRQYVDDLEAFASSLRLRLLEKLERGTSSDDRQ